MSDLSINILLLSLLTFGVNAPTTIGDSIPGIVPIVFVMPSKIPAYLLSILK